MFPFFQCMIIHEFTVNKLRQCFIFINHFRHTSYKESAS